ncbi:putative pectate lyase 3, partial [Mucuna pruriens]
MTTWSIPSQELYTIFERGMIIELRHELLISSNKTIEGHGANVQIKNGGGLTMQYVNNVIIHGICIKKIIDRVSLSDSAYGLINVIKDSTTITISNCHMTKHNNVLLFRAKYQHQAIMS